MHWSNAAIQVSLAFCCFFMVSVYLGGVDPHWGIFRSICSAWIMTALLYVLVSWKYGHIIFLFFLIFLALQIGYKIYFNERISKAILQSVAESNRQEIHSMIRAYMKLSVLVMALSISLMYVLFQIEWNSDWRIGLLLAVVSMAMLAAPLLKKVAVDKNFLPEIRDYPLVIGEFYHERNNLVVGDLSIILATYVTKHRYSGGEIKAENVHIKKINEGATKIILVMGESSFAGRYGVYGYGKNTTPNIASLKENSTMCLVDKVHSSAPITRDSVAMSLSFFTPEDVKPLFKEKSIINYATESGYTTHWLTSQNIDGIYGLKYGHLAKDSENIKFAPDDDALVEVFKTALGGDAEKSFIVLHTSGSHMPYDGKFDALDSEQAPDFDAYDKTIRKTDRMLKELIDYLDANRMDYSLMFTSDHGEIVGVGHGMVHGAVDQYLIPLFIKQSKNSQDICEFVETLRNDNGYVSGLSNKFILLKMLGFDVDGEYLMHQKNNDRILHSNGIVYLWDRFLESGGRLN